MPEFDLREAAVRQNPALWTKTLRYRARADLPFDTDAVPRDATLLFDTTVYIDTLKNSLQSSVLHLIASRPVLHAAPGLAELSLAIGLLDPADARTAGAVGVILQTLARVPTSRVVTPAPDLWVEASVLAGILARIQGIAKTDRRKLLNDCLLFLMAGSSGAVLLTRNVRDFDLLLRMKGETSVLFYEAE